MKQTIKQQNGLYVNILSAECEDQFDNDVDIIECDLIKQSEVEK